MDNNYITSISPPEASPPTTSEGSPTTSAHPSAAAAAAAHRLRPINTCLTCRARKVRCDRKHPCTQCEKSGRECLYETSPSTSSVGPSASTSSEQVKNSGSGSGVRHAQAVNKHTNKSHRPKSDLKQRISRLENLLSGSLEPGSLTSGQDQPEISPTAETTTLYDVKPETQNTPDFTQSDTLPVAASHLEINGTKTKYHGPLYWLSALDEELDDVDIDSIRRRCMIDKQSERSRSQEHGWMSSLLFPPHVMIPVTTNTLVSLLPSRPTTDQMVQIYYERVAPIVPILHKSTFNRMYVSFWNDTMPTNERSGFIALLCAVLHVSTCSMDPELAENLTSRDRGYGMRFYKEATQRALSAADFLESEELVTLQAFSLLLSCMVFTSQMSLWSSNKTNATWALIAVAVRIAKNMGLHRDPAQFPGINAVEIEQRRRLWYLVHHLAVGASSISSFAGEEDFDTKLPLNVNDNDIIAGQPLPQPRTGLTDMSPFLNRITAAKYYTKSLRLTGSGMRKVSKQEFQNVLNEVMSWAQRMEQTFFQTLRDDVPMERIVKLWTKLLMNKGLLLLYYPFSNVKARRFLPESVRESALNSACTIVECTNEIESDPDHMRFRWYFSGYIQYHALTTVLAELLTDPSSTSTFAVRAWDCVDKFFILGDAEEYQWAKRTRGSESWAVLRALYEKACSKRVVGIPAMPDVNMNHMNYGAGGGGGIDWVRISPYTSKYIGFEKANKIMQSTWDYVFSEDLLSINEYLIQSPPPISSL